MHFIKSGKILKKRYTTAMYKTIVAVFICLIVAVPASAHAGAIIRSGEKVSVDAGQVLKGDFYGFAPTVTLSGLAENDVYIGGGTVTINAPVNQDVTILGGVVQIHGDVGDDVRVIGGEVTLGKSVKGDVVVFGGTLTVLSTARIEGDILFMGGDLTVEGEVLGAILGTSENVRINSKVGGDITYVSTNPLVLGDKAEIQSDITYKSKDEIIRAQGAHVAGDIRQETLTASTRVDFAEALLFKMFILLFTASIIYLIMRKHLQSVVEQSLSTLGKTGLIGMGVLVIIPFVSLVLMVSVVGIFAGMLLFLLYVSVLAYAFVFGSILTGHYFLQLLGMKKNITWNTVLVGVLLFCAIAIIPYIGAFLLFGITTIALGGISLALYRAIRS